MTRALKNQGVNIKLTKAQLKSRRAYRLARNSVNNMAWGKRNTAHVNFMAAGVRNRSKAAKRFWCAVCKHAAATDVAL
jgi:hypothetical protein